MPDPLLTQVDRKVEKAIKLMQSGWTQDQFPEELLESLNRWSVAHELVMKWHHKGSEFIREIYKVRYACNDAVARQEIRCAQLFFGKTNQSNRNYERLIRIEFLKQQSYKAAAEGKFGEVAKLEAILQKYLDPAHDPIDAPDWDELRAAVQPVIEYNPEAVGVTRVPKEQVDQLWQKVQKRKNLSDFANDAEFIDLP